jgi:hypothetical protein
MKQKIILYRDIWLKIMKTGVQSQIEIDSKKGSQKPTSQNCENIYRQFW